MILNILKRENLLNKNYIKINESQISKNDKYSLCMIMNNWKSLDSSEHFALKKTMNILSEYVTNCNDSDKKYIINYFNNVVIPSIRNIKESKKDILKFSNDNNLNEYNILETCNTYISCNRVINNHKILNKKFKFDNFISEFKVNENNIDECIFELCSMIDKSSSNLEIKTNVALENIEYAFAKAGYRFENIEYFVSNYFSKKYNTNIQINEDMKTHLIDIKTKIPSIMKSTINKIYVQSPNQIINEVPNLFSWIRSFLTFSTVAINPILGILVFCTDKFIEMKLKRSETERFIKKYKSEREKVSKKYDNCKNEKIKDNYKKYLTTLDTNIKKLEDYEDNLYSEKERDDRMFDNMDDDITFENALLLNEDSTHDSIDKLIRSKRKSVSIEDYFKLDHTIVISQLDIAIKSLINLLQTSYRILSINDILVPASPNQINHFINSKENSLIKYLNADSKLNIEIGSLLPLNIKTNENMNKEISNILCDICSKLDDILGDRFYTTYEGTDDLYRIYLVYDLVIDVDYAEQFHKDTLDDIQYILTTESYLSNIYSKYNNALKTIDQNILKLESSIIDISEFSLQYSDIINPNMLEEVLNEHQINILKESDNSKYKKVAYISEGIYLLSNRKVLNKSNNKTRMDLICELKNINDIINNIESLNETSFLNTLKLTRERLSNSVKNLDSKQKTLSKQLDGTISKFGEKIDMTLSSQNRESVIKGTLIPSASRAIKIAVLTCAAWAVSPTIAVIGILGSIAMSKKLRRKEKQLILDEIDIELKLVEKKIQLAERNDDMKSLEKLLKIEKRLKREKQRIEYNLKVYYSTDFKANDD